MPPENTTDPTLERALSRTGAGIAEAEKEQQPLYKVIGDSKIPVSKHAGTLWASRKDQGLSARSNAETNWDEAIRYYDNDQSSHRTGADGVSGNRATTRLGSGWTETENVVFANCAIMVPMLYAKNPHVTITSANDANIDRAKCVERLINVLINKRETPGLNMKRKTRRFILTGLLTNAAFIKIGWTAKQDSSEEAIRQLQELSEELESASSKKAILAAEGKIKALEERIALVGPSGPWCRTLLPNRIVVDPTSVEPDGSDANWMMEWDHLPTSYINAVYTQERDGKIVSVYEPTHVIHASASSANGTGDNPVDDLVNNFRLVDGALDAATYGYANEQAFKAAQYTKVWYVWDKTTRRVLMFADNNWKWPLWVWDDPLRLPRFFPYFRLWFHEAPSANAPKGEVSYYLDQQDAINEIADEVRRGRQWAKRNIIYKKGAISQEDVEIVLRGDDGTARGIDIPDDQKINDVIFSFVPPALNMPELFNPDSKFLAINRITGINDALRGAQFKTNTTNKAIEQYNTNTDIRVDERVDLIEDTIGEIAWNIAMLCMMNWEAEDITPLVGQEYAQFWTKAADPREFETLFSARVEGGSTEKPNSRGKKEQTVSLLQGLGQFANAAPGIVIVALKMMERAFDEVVITDEEWTLIHQTLMMNLQKAGAGPGTGSEQEQQQTPAGSDEELAAQVRARIAALPPAGQAKLQELVQGGMPPSQALEQVEADIQPQ